MYLGIPVSLIFGDRITTMPFQKVLETAGGVFLLIGVDLARIPKQKVQRGT